jgi:hypothetical protein
MNAIEISKLLDFGVETGVNEGPFCRLVQAVANGRPKDPWCAHYVSTCIYIEHRGKPPFALSGGCDELLKAMRGAGLEREQPVTPGVFFVMRALKDSGGKVTGYSTTDAEHVGFTVAINTNSFFTREGNTSAPAKPGQTLTDAQLREGRVVGERWRPFRRGKYVFCALPEVTTS